MTTPPLRDTILRHIEEYAKNLPQSCLDSPTARALLAQHLADGLSVWVQKQARELVGESHE